jgi:hypothetical protein
LVVDGNGCREIHDSRSGRLGCTHGLIVDEAGKVVILWVRGIDRKLCVADEFWPEKLHARLDYLVPVLTPDEEEQH